MVNSIRGGFSNPLVRANGYVDLFNNLFNDGGFNTLLKQCRNGSCQPTLDLSADLQEDDNSYIVEVDVPGIKQDEINLAYSDDHLTLTINKEVKKDEKNKNYKVHERFYGSTSRTFYIPGADEDSIDANLSNGVLMIKIKKDSGNRSKKIAITVR